MGFCRHCRVFNGPVTVKIGSNGLAFTADTCPAQTEGVDDVTPPSLKEPDILMFRWLSRPWP